MMPSKRWGQQKFKGRVLRPSVHQDGYRCVNLQRQGVIKAKLVHILVYAAFKGPIPDGLEVNHDDGDKANCKLSNLEAMTPSQNVRHAHRTGLAKPLRGERHGNSKLTDADVRTIVSLLRRFSLMELATQFNCEEATISGIACGRSWRHVTGFTEETAPRHPRPTKYGVRGIAALAKAAGLGRARVYRRLKAGQTIEQALSTRGSA